MNRDIFHLRAKPSCELGAMLGRFPSKALSSTLGDVDWHKVPYRREIGRSPILSFFIHNKEVSYCKVLVYVGYRGICAKINWVDCMIKGGQRNVIYVCVKIEISHIVRLCYNISISADHIPKHECEINEQSNKRQYCHAPSKGRSKVLLLLVCK